MSFLAERLLVSFPAEPNNVHESITVQCGPKQAHNLLACYSDRGVVTTFSSFRSSDLSQSI